MTQEVESVETDVMRDDKGRFLEGYPPDKIENAGRKGWWELENGPEKLAKLQLAFSYGATDVEACAFAEISETNLYYYQKTHPEFTSKKKQLKSKVMFMSRKNVVDRISYENATEEKDGVTVKNVEKLREGAPYSAAYLKSHSNEFADRVDPEIGDKLGNMRVVRIELVDMSRNEEFEKIYGRQEE